MDEAGAATGHAIALETKALLATLRRLDTLLGDLARELFASRAPDREFAGMHVSDDVAAGLLDGETDPAVWSPPPGLVDIDDGSRLAGVARAFALSEMESSLLVVALAPELEQRYSRLYGYLQDDLTRRRPTVDFALGLLCPTLESRLQARACLGRSGHLGRHRLVWVRDDPKHFPNASWPSTSSSRHSSSGGRESTTVWQASRGAALRKSDSPI